MMKIRNVLFNAPEISRIARLYKSVWNTSMEDFLERFKRHATYPGFRGIVACEDEEIVGFAYGYTSMKGQYYHELLCEFLSTAEQNVWLADCFELVELVVAPSYRRNKTGKKLVAELIGNVSNQTALLTTQMDNLAARNLYEKFDWEIIQEDFIPNKQAVSYVIMGKKLNECTTGEETNA
jgi:ribosomal protein S18 acetylase RimI-like enzyme